MQLTPALKKIAEEKLGNAIMRVFDRPAAKIEIELNDLGHLHNGADKECRVSVFVPKGKSIVISEVGDDMYKAIHLAHDRLLCQVKRERERKLKTSRTRKLAAKGRALIARSVLTVAPEPWELELREYERSMLRA
jgi:ribosomal subunit interface protein